MKIAYIHLLLFLFSALISCNDGRFISPGIRSNMYLAEGVRTNSYPIENRVFVKAITLNQGNFDAIKEDINNFTNTKVTKKEIERLYSLDLKSKFGFLIFVGSRKRDSKAELVDLSIETRVNNCEPVAKIIYPYSFIIFDRLGLGILRPHIFSYPKYPVEAYAWQYEPTASNVDIWTKETLRALVLFSDKCASQMVNSLTVQISDLERNQNSYSFGF
ncbi:putative lipoprotein [Leptospira santarosai str. HAI821]|uniref:hypothetical protein n=1 Tax=Leptospira santarosai TaxID=28183 RepID=UPI0002BDDF7A|nr:hypothetical protein [Leptospira santarosai]EMO33212.1 putative lipoprotein [Leptospira santarosai str. HAI821]